MVAVGDARLPAAVSATLDWVGWCVRIEGAADLRHCHCTLEPPWVLARTHSFNAIKLELISADSFRRACT